MSGLPPICVSAGNKAQYFDALRVTGFRLDIDPLAKLLVTESLNALCRAKAIGGTHPTDMAYMFWAVRGHRPPTGGVFAMPLAGT